MSYFVTITFDLKDASMSPHGKNVYKKITEALEQIDYSTVVSGKKKKVLDLPNNTYIAEFDDNTEHQLEVVDFVKKEIGKIFEQYSVKGKFFISAGRHWAWKIGSF